MTEQTNSQAKRLKPALCALALIAGAAILPAAWAEDDMMMGGMAMEDDPPMGQMPGSGMQPMEPMDNEEPMGADPAMAPPPGQDGMAPMGPMRGRAGGDMRMMGMEKSGMGKKGMQGKGASAPAVAAPLPGFAGASGLYHMGATDFFLDHPEHVTLTDAQRKSLEAIKGAAQKEQAGYRQQIEQREGDLWTLTGADRPDAAAIDAKIREIESLRVKQRAAYIQAVGKAGQVLTQEQRKQLAGTIPAATAPKTPATAPAAAPSATHSTHAPTK